MFCPNCGKQQPDDANFCQGCGKRLAPETAHTPARRAAPVGPPASGFSDSERSEVLEHRIQELAGVGFVVATRTAHSAQLVKGKGLSGGQIVAGVVTFGLGILAAGLSKQPSLYLFIDQDGRTQITHSNGKKETLPAPRRPGDPSPAKAGTACKTCGRTNPPGRTVCNWCRYPL